MKDSSIYITINHLEDYQSASYLKPGDRLVLEKDRNNSFDDEAIRVKKDNITVGYVANSVSSVMRGTFSAGRVYDRIDDRAVCLIRFMNEDLLLAEILRED